MKHRRKLQQPWSLILQLLSLLLLLLAIAQLRFGSPDRSSRDHVLILDTSAWMAARTGNGRLIDQARAPGTGLCERAARERPRDGGARRRLATARHVVRNGPAKIVQAIDQTQPGAAALNIDQALDFAEQAQKLRAQRAGEIVFVGAGRVPGDGPAAGSRLPRNLRVIPVTGPTENCRIAQSGRAAVADGCRIPGRFSSR